MTYSSGLHVPRPISRAALSLAAALGLVLAGAAVPGAASAVPVARAAPAGRSGLIVSTDKGKVEGKAAEGIRQWLGVPYAAPPVGALRWQAPVPAQRWHGVRGAVSYGSRCAQLASGNGPRVDSEDCLYLNVFAPPSHGESGRASSQWRGRRGLPVLFMIHGGGLLNGSGDQPDGSLIVRTDHVIVVSINYRLGVFGYLDVPGLGTSPVTGHGNYGLLDQEAALRWVHRNIRAFGGDPNRVTIAGESAGGWSVCALLASPLARGLFRGAIMESGSCATQSAAAAQADGLVFAASAGCPQAATAAACLRSKPEASLLDASSSLQSRTITSGGPELPVAGAQAVASGRYTRVPVLMGTNHDEGRTFTQGFASLTEQQYVQLVDQQAGPLAPAILRRYPWSAYPSPYTASYAIGAIWTDSGFIAGIGGCPTQNLAAEFASTTPTFLYQFDDRHAPALNHLLPGYQWGAGHAMELAYLWPSFGNGFSLYDLLTPAQLELSHQMLVWWGAFTRTGAPAAPGQPAWPRYTSRRLMSLRPGDQSRLISGGTFAAQHQCPFWNATG